MKNCSLVLLPTGYKDDSNFCAHVFGGSLWSSMVQWFFCLALLLTNKFLLYVGHGKYFKRLAKLISLFRRRRLAQESQKIRAETKDC